MNSGYLWGLKQSRREKNVRPLYYYQDKKLRKQAKKKLSAIQQPGRYVHDMDNEMFDSVCEMLTSKDRRDKVMAHDIILSSKMNMEHMNYFIQNYYQIILNGVSEDIIEHTWTTSISASFTNSLPLQII